MTLSHQARAMAQKLEIQNGTGAGAAVFEAPALLRQLANAQDALSAQLALAPNLGSPSVREQLAAQWGFVPASQPALADQPDQPATP